MRDLAPRTLDAIDDAAINVTVTREIGAPTDVVFDALADAPTWPEWHSLTAASWVTDAPHGVGSRRQVAVGPLKILEEFIVWEPGERIAFTLVGVDGPASSATLGGVELMTLRQGTVGRTVLDYTFAVDVKGPAALVGPLAGPGAKLALGRALANLDKRLSRASGS